MTAEFLVNLISLHVVVSISPDEVSINYCVLFYFILFFAFLFVCFALLVAGNHIKENCKYGKYLMASE